jgi:SAM-dependent methyltransferase
MALDFIMGEGRNAIYLATRGFDVDGVDPDPHAVAQARIASRKLGVPIRAIVGNVEDGTYIIPIEAYDVIVVFNYLHRPLFQDIRDGLVPGGVVVYQTYTVEQARYGRFTDPDALLEPGELRKQFSDWEILRYRELSGASRDGEMRAVAAIVARKPA